MNINEKIVLTTHEVDSLMLAVERAMLVMNGSQRLQDMQDLLDLSNQTDIESWKTMLNIPSATNLYAFEIRGVRGMTIEFNFIWHTKDEKEQAVLYRIFFNRFSDVMFRIPRFDLEKRLRLSPVSNAIEFNQIGRFESHRQKSEFTFQEAYLSFIYYQQHAQQQQCPVPLEIEIEYPEGKDWSKIQIDDGNVNGIMLTADYLFS